MKDFVSRLNTINNKKFLKLRKIYHPKALEEVKR